MQRRVTVDRPAHLGPVEQRADQLAAADQGARERDGTARVDAGDLGPRVDEVGPQIGDVAADLLGDRGEECGRAGENDADAAAPRPRIRAKIAVSAQSDEDRAATAYATNGTLVASYAARVPFVSGHGRRTQPIAGA